MSKKLLFNVLLTCLNSKKSDELNEKDVRNSLNSVLTQSGVSSKIHIAANGVSRNVLKVILEYVDKYSCITYTFYEKPVSLAKIRNDFFKNADSEYSLLANAGDVYKPDAFKTIAAEMEKSNSIDSLRFKADCVFGKNSKGHLFKTNEFEALKQPISGCEAFFSWCNGDVCNRFCCWNLYAFRTSFFKDIQFPKNLKHFDDLALIPQILIKSKKVMAIDDVCCILALDEESFVKDIPTDFCRKLTKYITSLGPAMERAISYARFYIKNYSGFDECQKCLLSIRYSKVAKDSTMLLNFLNGRSFIAVK